MSVTRVHPKGAFSVKTFKLTLLLTLLVGLSACGTNPTIVIEPTPTATTAPQTAVADSPSNNMLLSNLNRLCLVVSEGADLEVGYWANIRQGVEAIASDYNLQISYVGGDVSGDITAIEQCLDQNSQVVITANTEWSSVTLQAALENPNIQFIGIDQLVVDGPFNYAGIQSREDEAAFLMGYLAGLVTRSDVVAGIYGPELPVTKRYREGYEQGVAYAAAELDKSIEVLGVYLDRFNDTAAGEATAQSFIEMGADVIFGASGPAGNQAILYAAQQGVYVIGSPQDMYYPLFDAGAVPGADRLISSLLKRVNVGLFDMLSMLLENNLSTYPSGDNYFLTLANGGLAFAAAHDADIPETIYTQVADLETAIIRGEVTTGVEPVANLAAQPDSAAPAIINQVCFVADAAIIQDNGFYQYTYQGIQAVSQEYNIDLMFAPEFTDVSDPADPRLADYVQGCVEMNAQVVVSSGFYFGEVMLAAAQNNPDVYFIGVDQFVANGPTNYVGIQFQEDEVAFLVGYLAGLVTESNIVAGIYGPDFLPLKRFRNGYEQGVRYAAAERQQDIEILGVYLDSFFSPDVGAETAQSYIDSGADVIFGAAGASGSGAILHAAQQQVYVIGVDQDEFFTTFQGGTVDGAEYLITSALKRVDIGVIDLLTILAREQFAAFPGGENYVLTVANGGLTFANPHLADIAPELYERVTEVEQQIASGVLQTGVDPITGELVE